MLNTTSQLKVRYSSHLSLHMHALYSCVLFKQLDKASVRHVSQYHLYRIILEQMSLGFLELAHVYFTSLILCIYMLGIMQVWYQLQTLTNTCDYTEPYNIEGYTATLHNLCTNSIQIMSLHHSSSHTPNMRIAPD